MRIYAQLIRGRRFWRHLGLWLYPCALALAFTYRSQREALTLQMACHSAAFAAALSASLLAAVSLLKSARLQRRVLRAVLLLQSLFFFASAYYACLYGQGLGPPAMLAILETDLGEARGFVGSHFRPDFALFSALAALPLFLMALRPPQLPARHPETARRHLAAPLALIALVAYLSVFTGRSYWTGLAPSLGVPFAAAAAAEEIAVASGYYSAISGAPPLTSLRVRDRGAAVTHILVIGESLNRAHMSLYGYGRPTTPRLARMAQDLLIARDVCSAHGMTIYSLKGLLTIAEQKDQGASRGTTNLIQLMRAAGFETYWISNQTEVGFFSRFASALAKSADRRVFVDDGGWGFDVSYDEKVLAPLGAVLSDGARRRFIVVHLIGSHEKYFQRYPAAYARFGAGARSLTDQYDNSVLYNDFVVSRLIGMQDPRAPVTVTYLSDHGEALGEKNGFFGHAEGSRYAAIYEIPMLFWVSKPLRRRLRDKLQVLRAHLSSPYQSDRAIHSLLDLYGVESGLLERDDSLFDASFRPKDRYCDHLR